MILNAPVDTRQTNAQPTVALAHELGAIFAGRTNEATVEDALIADGRAVQECWNASHSLLLRRVARYKSSSQLAQRR